MPRSVCCPSPCHLGESAPWLDASIFSLGHRIRTLTSWVSCWDCRGPRREGDGAGTGGPRVGPSHVSAVTITDFELPLHHCLNAWPAGALTSVTVFPCPRNGQNHSLVAGGFSELINVNPEVRLGTAQAQKVSAVTVVAMIFHNTAMPNRTLVFVKSCKA